MLVISGFSLSSLVAQEHRRIPDSDGDGWCDLWCDLFKEIEHRDKSLDTDGDGVTDYHEMLAMTNPLMKAGQPIDKVLVQRKAEIAFIESQKAWDARVAKLREKGVKSVIQKHGCELTDWRLKARKKHLIELEGEARKAGEKDLENKRLVEAQAARLGLPMEWMDAGGKLERFQGVENGVPIRTGSHNRIGAGSIAADELWPASLTIPWTTGDSGLNLTGDGQTVAIWEDNGLGGVRTSHGDLIGRVSQVDAADIDTTGHATAVAGVIIGSGSGNAEARGVAYEARVDAYEKDFSLAQERLNAAAGANGRSIITLGNNSWGTLNGWSLGFVPVRTQPRWIWTGSTDVNERQSPLLGRYTSSSALPFDCVEIDNYVVTAKHLLPVHSAGNDRQVGPGANTLPVTRIDPATGEPVINPATGQPIIDNTFEYFIALGGNQFLRRPSNLTTFKDWDNGDDGGYDSLSTPATAKNVLTVGSCLDVVYTDGGATIPGYRAGSAVVRSEFSGAGPTDDGRLKPDLVAVGEASTTARQNIGAIVQDSLVSPDSLSNSAYFTDDLAGTSFSSPAVTAGLALVLERRKELYFGDLAPGEEIAEIDLWKASTLKAIAINGVDDPDAPGPDFERGHGLFNARTSVEMVDEDYSLGRGSQIKEFSLDIGETVSWFVSVSSDDPLAITAAWSDPAGPGQGFTGAVDPVAQALVNDIDIQIEHLNSQTVLEPWVLNPDLANENAAVRSQAAVRGADSTNNVERISDDTPQAGIYLVTVTHSGAINNNSNAGSQVVSVVSTNASPLIPVIDSIEVSPDQTDFIFTYWSDPGAFYDIETSTTLESGSWTTVGFTVADGAQNTVTVDDLTAAPKRFFRLKRQQ